MGQPVDRLSVSVVLLCVAIPSGDCLDNALVVEERMTAARKARCTVTR